MNELKGKDLYAAIASAMEKNKGPEVFSAFSWNEQAQVVPYTWDELLTYVDSGWIIKQKPQNRSITTSDGGYYEFPEPLDTPPEHNTEYFYIDLDSGNLVERKPWYGSGVDMMRLRRGVVHLVRSHAYTHAEALIKVNGGRYGS